MPSNDLALPSRRGWTHSLPCHHQITLQVTTRDGRGDVFNPQGAVAVLVNAGLESPTLQPSWAWAAASQGSPAVLDLHQHSVVSPGLALLHVCGVLFGGEGERQGEKSFCSYENKPQTKRTQTKRQITPQSLPLTALKPRDSLKSPDSGFSENLRLTTDFYTFLKPLILASQPLLPSQCTPTALPQRNSFGSSCQLSSPCHRARKLTPAPLPPAPRQHAQSRRINHHQPRSVPDASLVCPGG